MTSRWLAVHAIALLSGCDRLLGLGETHAPIDGVPPIPDVAFPSHVINDPDGDFDGDGDLNHSDLCPLIDHSVLGGMGDRDHDGVGDLCDPHPDTAGDCLVLFDDFSNQTALSPYWQADGGPIAIGPGAGAATVLFWSYSDEEIVSLTVPLDLDGLTLIGYVQQGDQGPPPYSRAAVEMFVDLSRSPVLANGRPCAFESTGPGVTLEQLDTVNGADTPVTQVQVGAERVRDGTTFQLDWPDVRGAASGATPTGCHLAINDSGDGLNDATTVAATMPPSRTFAIRGIGTGLQIMAVAGWGHSCP